MRGLGESEYRLKKLHIGNKVLVCVEAVVIQRKYEKENLFVFISNCHLVNWSYGFV